MLQVEVLLFLLFNHKPPPQTTTTATTTTATTNHRHHRPVGLDKSRRENMVEVGHHRISFGRRRHEEIRQHRWAKDLADDDAGLLPDDVQGER